MSYAERESDERLAEMQARAEAAEARLAQIAELLAPLCVAVTSPHAAREALRLARGEEPA